MYMYIMRIQFRDHFLLKGKLVVIGLSQISSFFSCTDIFIVGVITLALPGW